MSDLTPVPNASDKEVKTRTVSITTLEKIRAGKKLSIPHMLNDMFTSFQRTYEVEDGEEHPGSLGEFLTAYAKLNKVAAKSASPKMSFIKEAVQNLFASDTINLGEFEKVAKTRSDKYPNRLIATFKTQLGTAKCWIDLTLTPEAVNQQAIDVDVILDATTITKFSWGIGGVPLNSITVADYLDRLSETDQQNVEPTPEQAVLSSVEE